MGLLNQCRVALQVALRGLQLRCWPVINTVIGTASVVGVFVVLLSIAAGYERTLQLSGDADNLLIMRAGARSELESSLTGEQARLIRNATAVAKDAQGRPRAAAEVYAIASVEEDGDSNNIALRGVEEASYQLRPRWRLVEGRKPKSGMRELLVGRRATQRFQSLSLGAQIPIADGKWTVVGVFEADGGVAESELWTDISTLQSAYQRGEQVQLVVVRLAEARGIAAFRTALEKDPRLDVQVETEEDYYSQQAQQMNGFVKTLGFSISFLMGLAAVFVALNAGYASTTARAREIATMIALGLEERAMTLSVLLESVALSLLGGVLGSALAYAFFDGHLSSTLFYSKDFAQVVFAFEVTAGILLQAIAAAVLIGVIGGLWPALSVTRLPAAHALGIHR
ncbi:ABC transporter permease [Microbulbifer sp. 2205BS26-8]|uniref:ABC transporter permease n=1 Tax=Microbulbifer sp. 2205BS26-8 TaxID=3064386 RepID=UPI00273FC55B|nr:ABC transporter permease [Microbulbifer sp. 2205BS26-8]MDP5210785.1 ABC transporter permease [Microbulbifer sp. 2205BS26-8]